MKFVKGMVMGTLISAGVVMLYNEKNTMKKNKMMKKGKQFIKNFNYLQSLQSLQSHSQSRQSHLQSGFPTKQSHLSILTPFRHFPS